MSLYRVVTKRRKKLNGVTLEAGMEVQVLTPENTSYRVNDWKYVEDSFMRTFGVSLRNFGCLCSDYLEIINITKKPRYSSGPKPFDKIVSISTSSFYPDRQEWIDIFARAEMESPITKQLFVNGPWGSLICEKPNRGPINISFPHNCNSYSMRDGCGLKSRLTNFISEDFNRLCWADITYVGPNEYNGDCPANLDELCVFYKNLRQKSKHPKKYILTK